MLQQEEEVEDSFILAREMKKLGGWFNPTAMLRPLQPMHSATVNESEGL
jgi:hypothetical protein